MLIMDGTGAAALQSLSALSRNQKIGLGAAAVLSLLLGGFQGLIALALLIVVGSAILSPPTYLSNISLPSLSGAGPSAGGGGGGGGGRGRGVGNVR